MAEQLRTAFRMAVGGVLWAAVVACANGVPPVAGMVLALQIWVPTVALAIRRYDHVPQATVDGADDVCL